MVRCPVVILNRPLRIALLSYRSKPHCGGQGVYLRHLSRELCALGHHVEVFSGQPYPELDPGPVLREVPSLDLYRDSDPFRTPRWGEYRDWADVLETAMMWGGAFPEPLTFSIRALRVLAERAADFDVVHDNQGLGYGMLGVRRVGLPLVTSIHHPISVDKRIDLASSGKLAAPQQAALVRVRPDAGPGGPAARRNRAADHRVRVVPGRHLPRLPDPARARAHHPAGRGHPDIPAAHPAQGAGPDRGGDQRRLTDQGDRHAAARGGQARHRHRRAPGHRGQARARHRTAGRAVVPGGPGHVHPRPVRRGARRRCWPARRSPWCRRCTRVSRCPRWSTWPRAPRWWRAGPGRFPRSPATPPSWSRRARTRNSRPCCAGCIDSPAERDALADRALRRVRERFAWSAVAEATAGQYLAAMEGLATTKGQARKDRPSADR